MTCLATTLCEVAVGSLIDGDISTRKGLLSFVTAALGEERFVASIIEDCLSVSETQDLSACWTKWQQNGQERWKESSEHMKAVFALNFE